MANFCRKCGCTLAPTNKFCTKCGTPVVEIKQNNTAPIHNENVQQRLHNLKETTVNASAAVKEKSMRYFQGEQIQGVKNNVFEQAKKSKEFFEGKIPLRFRNKKIYIIAAAAVCAVIIAVVALHIKPNSLVANSLSQEELRAYVNPEGYAYGNTNNLSEDTVRYLSRFSEKELQAYVHAFGGKLSEDHIKDGSTNLITLKDSDFIGKWEIVDFQKYELVLDNDIGRDIVDDNTIIITKDGDYQCGNAKGKINALTFESGTEEKGAYMNVKDINRSAHPPTYGILHGNFFQILSDDGAVYPSETSIKIEWQNEKHTEAHLSVDNVYVDIKKK